MDLSKRKILGMRASALAAAGKQSCGMVRRFERGAGSQQFKGKKKKKKWFSPFGSCWGAADRRSHTKLWLHLKLSTIQEKGTVFLVSSRALPPPAPLHPAPPAHPVPVGARSPVPAPRRGAARAGYGSPTWRAACTVSRCLRSASRMPAAICGEGAGEAGAAAGPGPGPARCPLYLADALLLPPLVRGQRPFQRPGEALVLLGRHQEPLPQRRLRPVLPPEPRRLPAVLGPAGHPSVPLRLSSPRLAPPLPPGRLPGQVLEQAGLRQRQPAPPPVPPHAAPAAQAPDAPIVLGRVVGPHGPAAIALLVLLRRRRSRRRPGRRHLLLQPGQRLPQPPPVRGAVQVPAAGEGGAAAEPAVVHRHGGPAGPRRAQARQAGAAVTGAGPGPAGRGRAGQGSCTSGPEGP